MRALARTLAAFLVPFAIYFVARWAYFGELLPNTFYLKVGHDLTAVQRGLDYVRTYLAERSYVPLVALLAPLVARTAMVYWLTLFALLHTAYVVYVGGDFYAGHRFLLVLDPYCALLTGAVLIGSCARCRTSRYARSPPRSRSPRCSRSSSAACATGPIRPSSTTSLRPSTPTSSTCAG